MKYWLCILVCTWSLPVLAEGALRGEVHGLSAFEKGAYGEAAEALRDPYRKAVAYYRAGDFARALEMFRKVAPDHPQGMAAQFNAGNSFFQLHHYAKAAEAYKAVLAKEPEHADAANNLALAEAMMKQEAEGKSSAQEDKGQGKDTSGSGQGGQPQPEKNNAQKADESEKGTPSQPKGQEEEEEGETGEDASETEQDESAGAAEPIPSRSDAVLERMLQQMQTDPADIVKKRIEQKENAAAKRNQGVLQNATPW